MTRGALHDLADLINAQPWPSHLEHDPTRPPIGRVRNAQLRKLDDGELACVAEAELFDTGYPVYRLPPGPLPAAELPQAASGTPRLELGTDSRNLPDRAALEKLRDAASAAGEVELRADLVRRSLEPDPILIIALGAVGPAATWFAKGFFTRAGDELGAAVGKDLAATYRRFKTELARLLRHTEPVDAKPVLLFTATIEVGGRDVELEGSLRSRDPAQIGACLDAGRELLEVGIALAEALQGYTEVRKLHLAFDPASGTWVARFGTRPDAETFLLDKPDVKGG